jgi:hypothetical protein
LDKPQPIQPSSQPLPVSLLLASALAVHLPLLLMELPLKSYDADFHIFFASHYLHHWFNPWNTKWYAGFSQTAFPPLAQQWVAVIARGIGLDMAYMAVQMIAILLLVVGVYRFARLWVNPRTASIAALASIFLGSECLLVYFGGQLAATCAAPLYLNAVPFLFEWVRRGGWRQFLKAAALFTVAAACDRSTLLFGAIFFVLPVLALAFFDKEAGRYSTGALWARFIGLAVFVGVLIAFVLLPFWITFIHSPANPALTQHPSLSNYMLSPHWGITYFVVPYGAMILALPFIFFRGSAIARLRPLLFGFWIAFLIGLGGTTPVASALLGRAIDVMSMERFTYWATLLALPIVGVLADEILARFSSPAVIGLATLAFFTCGLAVAWSVYSPEKAEDFKVAPVAEWLNRGGHDRYRYFTLGFGNKISRLAMLAAAESVDGESDSGRMLPELKRFDSGSLTDSQDYGERGLAALSVMLKDADRYGVKWVFVRDHSYDPLLYFSGWQAVDSLEDNTIVVWTKDGVPPAAPVNSSQMPPPWQGLMWGIFPFGSSILAVLILLIPERKRRSAGLAEPAKTGEENPIFGRLVS